ncbi:MAG: amino acid ABC transporter permease [Pseudochelatococcus sp.]|jgi:general L-amino acid transport system permease protein|uniref:amino acid ABC transporter permease n=1 Tax=Pseudochelatococcus sp. TaxID=2020869 RepID=UPI003D8ADEA9
MAGQAPGNTPSGSGRPPGRDDAGGSWLYNPAVRGAAYQLALAVAVGFILYEASVNAIANMRRLGIVSGFDFWNAPAGFDINQKLIAYSSTYSTYGDAFWVGLLNTLLVAGMGIVLATVLGFIVGVARLSGNRIISVIATSYVEFFRNIPLLLQLYVWYNAVLRALPAPRQSVTMGDAVFLNNRGLFVPDPVFGPGSDYLFIAAILACAAILLYRRWARRDQDATGRQHPAGLVSLALLAGFMAAGWLAAGQPVTFNVPELRGFNIVGGLQVYPEFVALLLGLSIYTASFIAEIVRAGILSVSRGQTEAAYSLGLRPGVTQRLVIIPQAMRVIVPPLTSQLLNLTKNSSLAVAIGYPDLVQVFMGTVLNQTGQAIECVVITMLVYLLLSLLTSLAMNIYNRRVAIIER